MNIGFGVQTLASYEFEHRSQLVGIYPQLAGNRQTSLTSIACMHLQVHNCAHVISHTLIDHLLVVEYARALHMKLKPVREKKAPDRLSVGVETAAVPTVDIVVWDERA